MKKILHHLKAEWYKYVLEILVITIGILGAFMLNSWKERRDVDQEFLVQMESFYNSIYIDLQYLAASDANTSRAIQSIQKLIDNPDTSYTSEMIYHLYELVLVEWRNDNKESSSLSNLVDLTTNNEGQKKVLSAIRSYSEGGAWMDETEVNHSKSKIKELLPDLPIPFTLPQGENYGNDFFTEEDVEYFNKIAKTWKYINFLKTLQTDKQWILIGSRNNMEDGRSAMELIKTFHPDLHFHIDNVGMIGSALKGWTGSEVDLPMKRVSETIWEVEVTLKQGELKFRNRKSWNENWGGNSYPSGTTEYYGPNIIIKEAGDYRVSLDLANNSYHFEKLK